MNMHEFFGKFEELIAPKSPPKRHVIIVNKRILNLRVILTFNVTRFIVTIS